MPRTPAQDAQRQAAARKRLARFTKAHPAVPPLTDPTAILAALAAFTEHWNAQQRRAGHAPPLDATLAALHTMTVDPAAIMPAELRDDLRRTLAVVTRQLRALRATTDAADALNNLVTHAIVLGVLGARMEHGDALVKDVLQHDDARAGGRAPRGRAPRGAGPKEAAAVTEAVSALLRSPRADWPELARLLAPNAGLSPKALILRATRRRKKPPDQHA